MMDGQDDNKDILLMGDGASVHLISAAKTQRKNRSFAKMKWPAQSPYLNPIENLWNNLKDAVQNRDRTKNVEEMAIILGEEYSKVFPEMLRCLVDSMPRRFASVLATKGGSNRW